jgi:signal transduction histidine kinase
LLLVEDAPSDAELLTAQLERSHLEVDTSRVDSAETLRTALLFGRWDAILSDYGLPGFSGEEAVAICRELAPQTPCMLVTGSLTLEEAASSMRGGVVDCFIKDDLTRLPGALRREVKKARVAIEATEREALLVRQNTLLADVGAEKARTTTLLYQLAIAMSGELEPDRLISLAAEAVPALIHADHSAVCLWDDPSQTLRLVFETAVSTPVDAVVGLSDSALGLAFANRVPVAVNGYGRRQTTDPALAEGFQAVLAVPLVVGDRAIGAIATYSVDDRTFSPSDEALLATLAAQVAPVLDMARLHSVSEAKSRFLAAISHELRTPLNAILGFSELLLGPGVEGMNPKQVRYVNNIESSGKHLLALVNDVLDLTKFEAGRMVFESASFLLQDLLEEVLTTMGPIADQHGIALQLVDCDIDIQVNADAVRLGQILLNLASNAVKFNRDGGRVTIGSRLAADQVVIDVTDTGIGIPKVELANIFEEFNQLNQTSARARSGTGLGLTLSRRLARGMGGTVEVKSQMGVGSTFTISLPSGAPATNEEQAPAVRTAARVAAADEGVVAALPIA